MPEKSGFFGLRNCRLTDFQPQMVVVNREMCDTECTGKRQLTPLQAPPCGRNEEQMILADKIAQLRRQQGWSQEELANQLDVSRQAVSKWESGDSLR